MKVIWAYENINGREQVLSQIETYMLISSVKQWQKYHPEDTRVLYCDKSFREFLGSLGVLNLFDEVIVLYLEDLPSIDPKVFWSRIKLLALYYQEEPVIIMDHDFITLCPLKEFLNPKRVCYCNRENAKGYYPSNVDSYIRQLSIRRRWPEYSVNVGFLYLPFPEFTREYAEVSLKIMEELSFLKVPNSKYLIFAEQLVLSSFFPEVPHQSLLKPTWNCCEHAWDTMDPDITGIFTLEEAQRSKFIHYERVKKSFSPSDFRRELAFLQPLASVSPEVTIKIDKLHGFEHS